MSAWRRKAIALFPEHQREFEQADYGLFELFLTLMHDLRSAHAAEIDDPSADATLQRIYGFAEWCLRQGGDLWNRAAIGFFEDVMSGSGIPWDQIAPWISPYTAEQIEGTWALGVGGEHQPKFREALRMRHREAFRTHVAATGAIDAL